MVHIRCQYNLALPYFYVILLDVLNSSLLLFAALGFCSIHASSFFPSVFYFLFIFCTKEKKEKNINQTKPKKDI